MEKRHVLECHSRVNRVLRKGVKGKNERRFAYLIGLLLRMGPVGRFAMVTFGEGERKCSFKGIQTNKQARR